MKKSLLALAVLGAFAGAASAQTNVTIYGLVDAAVQYSKVSGATGAAGHPQWSMTDANGPAGFNSNKNGSRLGFRGTEDLGGGLSGIFVMENGFQVDNGQSRTDGLFSRQAFVGLQGAFGAVKLGRQYTPTHLAADSIDPFGTGMAGNIGNVFSYTVRTNNTVNFSTTAAGLNAQVAYSLGEQADDNTAGRQVALGLGYANGPVNVQFAYHNAKANPFLAALTGTPTAAAIAADTAARSDVQTALLGAVYDLRVAKVHAAFMRSKSELGTTGVENGDSRNYMLGVSAPIGAGEVRASVAHRDNRNEAGTAGTRLAGDFDQYALGYVHNLSKRTNVYTSYARTNDQSSLDRDGNLFNVGVQHKF